VNENRFAVVTHSLTSVPSRRDVVRGLVGAALGLGVARWPAIVEAKKKRKKLERNAFGCVEVGGQCRGKDAACCSGMCQGRKPKKGEKDTSRCVAHDASTCLAGQQEEFCGGTTTVSCTTSTGASGTCNVTTGKAPYCAYDGDCIACRKDADCRPGYGPAAACITCTGCPTTGGTACARPNSSST
jgi:hypothetical protein